MLLELPVGLVKEPVCPDKCPDNCDECPLAPGDPFSGAVTVRVDQM